MHTPQHSRKEQKRAERFRSRVFIACWCIVMSLMVYGIIRYPYAPIRFRDGGYVDKTGGEFPAEKFPAYQIWERTLYVSFGGTAISMLIVTFITRHRRSDVTKEVA
jgi:hypothetical protein